MTGLFALAAIVLQSVPADSLRTLARDAPAYILVTETRAAPLAAREAVGDGLRAGELDSARRLADAYAEAWQDSFLVREVARFEAWPRERRMGRLWADSLRRVGITAYAREGADAAIAIWRRALVRAETNGDTALAAAISGNIGTGFLQQHLLDSADTHLFRSIQWSRTVGDLRVEANALTGLGAVSDRRGDAAAARTRYAAALELQERMGDTRGLAAVRNNLGLLAWQTGDLPEARRQFEVALDLNRRDGRDVTAATNLINLAGVAGLQGDLPRAGRLYREALVTWQAHEDWAAAADGWFGLGLLELRRGDYPAARASLEESLALFEQTGPLTSELGVRRALAGALAAQGDMQGALDALRAAEDLAGSGTQPDVQAGLAITGADLAVQMNSLADAERSYVRAEGLYREAGDQDGVAEARHGRGLLLMASADYAAAEAHFESALRVQEAAGNLRAAGLTRLAAGQTARARGDTTIARERLTRAAAELARAGDSVGEGAALGELAGLAEDIGLPASAEMLYRQAIDRIASRVVPDVAWRLYGGLARARIARGAPDDAAGWLRAAAAEIERGGMGFVLPERRAAFLADKWDIYAQLALLEQSRGLPGAAFEVSERLRGREMLELLGRGRVGLPTDADAPLVAREQDLRRRIAELTSELEGVARGPLRGPTELPGRHAVREAMLAVQGEYADLLLEIRERAPRHAELVSPRSAGWREVARQLRDDEALVEYLVGDFGSLAFVVTPDTLAVIDLGIDRHDLARLVAFARGTVEAPRPGTDSLWHGPFRRLHKHLVAPIEETGLLSRATHLIVVPHAELQYLPFAALLGERGPLIERYELATTPSATIWLTLGDRPGNRPTEGVLAMAPRPGALPGSRREVEAVKRLAGGGTQVLTGADATEAAFLRAAPTKRVLHLATYGVLNQHNPLFSFVAFAPDGEQDGRLEVHEVFGLDLHADLVVLSACQTGLGSGRLADVPAGDDWVGLTRAFLHAGARSVVATLWAVEDGSTAALMERFYEEYSRGAAPDRALAVAQRALLERRATAHPFHWAGVAVVEGRR